MNASLMVAVLTTAFTSILASTPAKADVASGPEAARCASLVNADFSHVLDAPTQVTEAQLTAGSAGLSTHCEVKGYVTPTVGFFLAMPPQNWNGKFLELGCGGFCGGIVDRTRLEISKEIFIGPKHRDYAVLIFDGGHATAGISGLWGYNNLQAQFDFGVRAPHVAALAGKAITEHYYKRAPIRSYFSGCSSGGQQAFSEAQRFPWDFDGILAGAPSPTFSGPMMYYLWSGRALAGKVNKADLKLVHEAALARCDMDDGLKDGVIGDPLHCKFGSAQLLCKPGENSGCLTQEKVDAIKKVYSGPTTSEGVKIYTGGPLPGSELNWIRDIPGTAYVYGGDKVVPWSGEYFRYIGFMPAPGPGWNPQDFDFDRDYKRLRVAESLFGAADNLDLRKFKAAGGKMILYQGGQDESDIPTDAVDYYETAEKTLGGRASTQEFFRLFLIPGMNHCLGGAGAWAIDYVSYLEDWVERGQAPAVMIGSHLDMDEFRHAHPSSEPNFAAEFEQFRNDPHNVKFTRPMYPYPVRARYQGNGDPNKAASFAPVNP